MESIRPFGGIGRSDAALAGGKGASLGEMTQAGIPVPPGFVILASAFDRFLEEADLAAEIDAILHTVNRDEISSVEHASEKIQKLIIDATMPTDLATDIEAHFKELGATYVAVRSSATAEDSASAAWAGQLDTYLNTTQTDLLKNVQRCWASLFTPRAIFYRFEKKLHEQHISVAVVVQKMVESQFSGIAFSVHPVTEDYNQLIIEAGFGLGEAIVSGQVTPDSYVLEKEPRRIIDINVSAQTRGIYRVPEQGGNEWRDIPEPQASSQVLSEPQINELTELILRIEKHYGFPCDIEWAFEGGKFYITQSRPITTLSSSETTFVSESLFKSDSLKDFDYSAYQYLGLWTSDLFAMYFWAFWLDRNVLSRIHISIPFEGYLMLSGGHNLVRKEIMTLLREQAETMIRENNYTVISDFRKVSDEILSEAKESALRMGGTEPTPQAFQQFVEQERKLMTCWSLGFLLSEVFDELLLATATDAGIAQGELIGLIPQPPSLLAEQQKELRELSNKLDEAYPGSLASKSIVELEMLIEQDSALLEAFTQHVVTYGWIELLNFVGERFTLNRALEQMKAMGPAQATSAPSSNPNNKDMPLKLRHILDAVSDISYVRQAGAEYSAIVHYYLYDFLEQTASKLHVPYRDMLHLVPQEILNGLSNPESVALLKELAARRAKGNWLLYADIQTSEMVLVDEEDDVKKIASLVIPRAPSGTDLQGQTGNPGNARGKVSVILGSDDFSKFVDGNILVTTMTTPDFILLMQKSTAIVTDIGGMLSHAAIVSRELGKPCVIGTKFATQVFKDGDEVEVDADTGTVRVLTHA